MFLKQELRPPQVQFKALVSSSLPSSSSSSANVVVGGGGGLKLKTAAKTADVLLDDHMEQQDEGELAFTHPKVGG